MNFSQFIQIMVQASGFIAAFAAITAGIIMGTLRKQFETGILAEHLKMLSIGILFLAIGIILDVFNAYIQLSNIDINLGILILKYLCFLIGMYIIIISVKKTSDKLKSLIQ